jgi:uncharacterized protein (TIGR03066 family)
MAKMAPEVATMRASVLIVVGCLLLALPACQKAKPTIIGKWQRVDGDSGQEFRADGTVHVFATGRSGEGKYRLDGDTTIVMLLPDGSESSRWTVLSLTADEMEIATEKFPRTKYRRVK